MVEYLLKFKGVIDALSSTGLVVYEEEQILHVLAGLNSEYDSFVISVIILNRLSLRTLQLYL